MLYNPEPSPMNDELTTDAVKAPTKSIEPVFWVFVVMISSIEGPNEPSGYRASTQFNCLSHIYGSLCVFKLYVPPVYFTYIGIILINTTLL